MTSQLPRPPERDVLRHRLPVHLDMQMQSGENTVHLGNLKRNYVYAITQLRLRYAITFNCPRRYAD
jgi:hypothetical protein